ncbi:intra-flagellar transport protein 57 [Pelagophyceae sp. CCMP2097]|nr:intra-flagellar transport protein 57 [Pelagophyceae sp. CCMP2097]
MEDDEGGDAARRAPRAAAGPVPNDSLMQMEHVSDKLKLLRCGEKFCKARDQAPLQRWCFAIAGVNPSIQFQLFLDLCSWLMTEVTGDANFFRVDKFDDPNTSVNKMMLALRKLEFGLDFPTSKLKLAHGEAAVSVLDFLTDKACEKHFTWARPEYGGERDDDAVADDDADVGGIDDAIEDLVDEDEAMFKEAPAAGSKNDADLDYQDEAEYKEAHRILKSAIDPIVWQTELERVGPRLRLTGAAGGKEWRAHIEQTKVNEAAIRVVLPATEKRLQAMSERIRDAKDRITLKESYINKQFETKKDSFAALKDELDACELRFHASTENVTRLTGQLAGISEQLDEMKGTMADRGNSMTDTSPLVQIKQALKQIKLEVVTFDLQIGVVGHSLMQQKLRHGNAKSQSGSGFNTGFKLRGKMNDDATPPFDDSDAESL